MFRKSFTIHSYSLQGAKHYLMLPIFPLLPRPRRKIFLVGYTLENIRFHSPRDAEFRARSLLRNRWFVPNDIADQVQFNFKELQGRSFLERWLM